EPRRQGVPQGSPVSPLLANLYLHPLDQALAAANLREVRYADDFLVLCATRSEAEAALLQVRELLGRLHLQLNEEKTRVTHFEAGFRFLGLRFEGGQVTPVEEESGPWLLPAEPPASSGAAPGVSQTQQAPHTPQAPAEPAAAAQPGMPAPEEAELLDPESVLLDGPSDGVELPRSLYVTSQGVRVTKAGERLLVSRGQDAIARIPLHQLDQIVIHGNALVSTAIIRYCHEHQLELVFADDNGAHAVGLDTLSESSLGLLKAQMSRDTDEAFRLGFARACVEGKLHNSRAILQRFARRESPEKLQRAFGILGRCLRRLPEAQDMNGVRGLEGRAAAAYFAALGALVPETWAFSSRNRRPPRDPVNALLSYGYAVLSHVVQTAVQMAHLHPGFGHLHSFVAGRPALVCDLMEEFRPLVVDAVVLTLARGHQLKPGQDFTVTPEGCHIERAARQTFIGRLEAKLAAPVRHEQGQTSLHRIIRRQAVRYARALAGDEAYRPYRA
ncbi:MAG: CRISPR-associated endonuclease Cas1, partial [Zoogloea sp.]|uniref:CRISPR-associated endonuclease Cas1 n=1 Tax=Zoogloea sp. TaxID=49181 RepID=UPI003F31EFE7